MYELQTSSLPPRWDGCLIMACVLMFLGFVAMPIVGLIMLITGQEEEQAIGVLLMIVGVIIWIMMASA